MIRLIPLLLGTSLAVTGAFGFQEFKHQDATVYFQQKPAGTVGNLTAQAALTRVSSGLMTAALHPGVEHSHVESGSSPDNQVGRAGMEGSGSIVSASFLIPYE